MDDITFRSDTVLSDIHLHIPNKRHLVVRLNAVGQPVFLSRFHILHTKDNWEDESPPDGNTNVTLEDSGHCAKRNEEETDGNARDSDILEKYDCFPSTAQQLVAVLDEDGDLEVRRRPLGSTDREEENHSRDKVHPIILTKGYDNSIDDVDEDCNAQDVIKIEHTMATTLEDVGKQVWRGAFLLADYVLWNQDLFKCCTVLELGAGTGFTSIIMATVAKTVYCTDVGEDLLDMCERNVTLNRHLTEPMGGEVKVKTLDWLKNELCEDPDIAYNWSEEEVADLYNQTTVILCADETYYTPQKWEVM